MAFSRTKYDECQHQLQIKRSTSVGDYHLFAPAHESCNRCYSYHGPVGSQGDVSMPRKNCMLNLGDKAEAESHLTNRVIPENNCNGVGSNQGYLKFQSNNVHADRCNPKVNALDTRFSHPLDAYRGMNTMEYQFEPYLHTNPQCQVWNRPEVYSRFISRDTYVIPKQEAWDNGKALPAPKSAPKITTSKCNVCAN